MESLGGGQVLLRGAALVDTRNLARSAAQQATRRDGIGLPQRIRSLLAVLDREAEQVITAMSANGPTDVRRLPDLELSEPDKDLTASEVAEMMQCTARHVRRCAETLGGRRVGGRWVFTRAEVVAYLAGRRDVA